MVLGMQQADMQIYHNKWLQTANQWTDSIQIGQSMNR